ncbi:hypothetical protein NXC24_PB00053 (plasmid) [Rhizobium sp. NXC24]|nr:hypothetical protein NXC24_PB00053 [Rhizobium sp. NXC24]
MMVAHPTLTIEASTTPHKRLLSRSRFFAAGLCTHATASRLLWHGTMSFPPVRSLM